MGVVVVLGTLLGLIVLIYGVVIYYDPEARGTANDERDR